MGITSGIKLAPLLVDIKADIKGFKDSMSKAATAGVAEAKKISKSLANVTKVGDSLSNIGGKFTKFVSVPLAGVGVGIGKMAMDFESAIAKVSTIADNTQVPMKDMEKAILNLSRQTGISANDIANNVYDAISAGQKTGDAVNFVSNATKLAKAGFAESADTLDILTTIMNSYGLEAKEVTKVSDILINTQNIGKTTVAELSGAMGKVIPTAKSLGVNLEQLSTGYAIMTSKGVATAETTTYVNAMLNELGKTGTVADKVLRKINGKSFKQLIKEGKSVGDVLAMMDAHAKKNNLSLSDMFGSAEAGKSALILVENAGKDFNNTLDKMKDSTGATDEAFNKMAGTTENKIKIAVNKLKVSGIELGKKLLPIAQKVIDGLSNIADKFANLSDEQQNNILKWGAIAMAAGPTLKIVGGGIKIFTTLKSVIGGVSKALSIIKGAKAAAEIASVGSAAATATGTAAAGTGVAGFVSTLGGVAVAAAPFVAVAATIAGSAYIVHKSMEGDCIEPVDLFADKVVETKKKVEDGYGGMIEVVEESAVKISDSTKKTVGAYMDMDTKTAQSVYDMYIKHTTITDDIYKDMTGKFAQMGKTIKDSQQQKYTEMLADYKGFFDENSTLTYTREQEILQTITTKHNERQQVIDDAMKRINTIYDSARDMHRDLTEQEMMEIGNIQGMMKEKAVNTLSETEQEAAVIRERMAEHDGRLTAEMASNAIKQANNARDKEIKAATDKYEGIVKKAATLKAAGDITQEEYDKMVKAARETKDEQIKHAMLGAQGIKNEIEKKNPGIWEAVDKQTGGIRGKWSRLWENIKNWWNDIWSWGNDADEEVDKINKQREKKTNTTAGSRHFNGLNYVPFDGYSAILHKGERVLTREENKAYNGAPGGITQNVTINSPKQLSPIEIAQQNKYMLQQLGLGM